MNTVAICNLCMKEAAPNHFYEKYFLDGEEVLISLLDVEETDYDLYFDEKSILIKVNAFSCNFRDRSLIHYFSSQCRRLSGDRKYFYSPIGSEFAGVVVKRGSHVTAFQIGDRVMGDMTFPFRKNGEIGGVVTNYASQRLLLLKECQLRKIPDCMSNVVAAAFVLSAQTAYSMVRKAKLSGGENVLLTAATSNTSLAIIERLKSFPVNVYAISSKATSVRKQLLEMGVKDVFTVEDMSANVGAIQNIKFDVVFDPFIDLYINRISRFLNWGAKYIFCGFYRQNDLFVSKSIQEDLKTNSIYSICITLNLSLIGNCLGDMNDLNNAILDYMEGKFSIRVDSVYTGTDIKMFFDKTFLKERFGKVVYEY